MNQAFILGAGLGKRLRPLTGFLPKPLVPLFHRPLAEWAMEACFKAGIQKFAINTHHLPEAWDGWGEESECSISPVCGANGESVAFRKWEGMDVSMFHEPILLETGGGLKNIAGWIGDEPLLIHNGDIFSTLPLEKLIAAHEASGLPVTLALRTEGDAKHIALDAEMKRVTDIRRGLHRANGTHVFSGIYCISPEFLEMIPAGEKVSVIPYFLELARAGKLGAIVLDDGAWLDLGDRASYLKAHRELALAPAIHPLAVIGNHATVENSIIGPGAVIRSGAVVRNSVVWAGRRVEGDADLDGCIVCSDQPVSGLHRDADL
ncbi:MAG: NTP transferase domain-containing protein [Gloeobacteraceae cyanobacterium ES-bin-144]|nr:NTP transferase domain-containing protein [Verrucomicrobiales bacterium]